MNAYNFATMFIAIVFIFITSLPTSFQKRYKRRQVALALCGDDFVRVYFHMCELQRRKLYGSNSTRERKLAAVLIYFAFYAYLYLGTGRILGGGKALCRGLLFIQKYTELTLKVFWFIVKYPRKLLVIS